MTWTPKHRRTWEKKTRPLTTRVDEETYEEVKNWARWNRMSLGEALRCFITWGLQEWEKSQ